MGYEVDFHPVGEGERSGDAITLRFGNLFGYRHEQIVVVIDGGFEESAEHLIKHVEQYYSTDYVDLVVSTHPDADHAAGLKVVLEQLGVGCLWMHQPWNHTDDIAKMFKSGRVTDDSVRASLRKSLDTVRGLERFAQSKGIPIIEPFVGVCDTSGCLFVVGPSQPFYESLLPHFRGMPEPMRELSILAKILAGAQEFVQKVAERWDYETLDDTGGTSAENETSAILLLSVDNRRLLFTADGGIMALTEVADRLDAVGFDYATLEFIQVPHHGSKRNVGPTILNRLVGPKRSQELRLKTAFVSASKEGNPKHPAKKVTNAFKRRGAPVHATQGITVSHRYNAPDRPGWGPSIPLPFYHEVEE